MYYFVYADEQGNAYVDKEFFLLGRSGNSFVEPLPEEMIPLPEGASLISLPEREAVTMDAKGSFVKYPRPGLPIGGLLPQGYTRTLLPAFSGGKGKRELPLFGYSALGYKDGIFYVAALATDEDDKWNPKHYNTASLSRKISEVCSLFPDNRLIKQLAYCAEHYGCFTAQNLFYQRWEGGVPTSPACNAACLGCISLQESECCPSPQQRINFTPNQEEISQVLFFHLENAREGIISFGQGCEGEPSLQYPLIAGAIREVRKKVNKGTINMNTNAGNPEAIRRLCAAGMDSFRVSINSAIKLNYESYYRPRGYNFTEVVESLKIAAAEGVYTYLNLLFFPGVNDTPREIEALLKLIAETELKAIQFRNLNIDPDRYLSSRKTEEEEFLGVKNMLDVLKGEFPALALGNYSKPLK